MSGHVEIRALQVSVDAGEGGRIFARDLTSPDPVWPVS